MKNKLFTILLVISLVSVSLFLLTSCGENIAKLDPVTDLKIIGDCVFWEQPDNANGFAVSVNGNVTNQRSNYYRLDSQRTTSATVTVTALGEKGKFLPSDSISVTESLPTFATQTFKGMQALKECIIDGILYVSGVNDIILDLSDDPTTFFSITVSSKISRLQVIGRADVDYKGELDFGTRGTNCYLSLENVSLSNANEVVMVDFADESNMIFINVKGDNKLICNGVAPSGEKGKDGEESFGAAETGKPGRKGSSGISAKNVYIGGNGSLIIKGGAGGSGGEGGAGGSGLFAAHHGSGGNGGSGGNAIFSNSVFVDKSELELSCYGGEGGQGGAEGAKNGSYATRYPGSDGKDGLPYPNNITEVDISQIEEYEETTAAGALSSPKNVKIVGEIIIFDKVFGATSYDIFKDNVLIGTSTENYYAIGIPTANNVYHVIAKADNKTSSVPSKKISAIVDTGDKVDRITSVNNMKSSWTTGILGEYKVVSSSSDVVLDISREAVDASKRLDLNAKIIIPSKIKSFAIVGIVDTDILNLNLVIENRTTNIKVLLYDVKAKAQNDSNFIEMAGEISNQSSVMLEVYSFGLRNVLSAGDSTFVGKKGEDSTTMTNGTPGGVGNVGYSAIKSSILYIGGDAPLTLKGGQGGNGGNGGDSYQVTLQGAGRGGDGGAGGVGIDCVETYIYMSNNEVVTALGGSGGVGGKRGVDGAIIHVPNGATGATGEKNSGNILVLAGFYK